MYNHLASNLKTSIDLELIYTTFIVITNKISILRIDDIPESSKEVNEMIK